MEPRAINRPTPDGWRTINLVVGEILVEHSMDGDSTEPPELKVNVYAPGAWSGFYIRAGAARVLAAALVALADEVDEEEIA